MLLETPEAQEARLLSELRTAQLVRQRQVIANLRVKPQPFWTQALQNIWSRTFYLAPLAFPLLIIGALKILRPRELDLRAYVLTWAFAGPIGFLLWVFAWKTYGAGTGQVTATVATTALIGWCVWNRGVYLAAIDRKFAVGISFCVASFTGLFYAKAAIGTGIGPVKLAIAAAIVGVAIPLTIAFVSQAKKQLRAAVRKFGSPVWAFLTQPVTFRKCIPFSQRMKLPTMDSTSVR